MIYNLITRIRRFLGYGSVAVAMGAGMMHPAGLDLVKHFEGYEREAYIDPVGVKTIGYGHTERAGTLKFNMGDEWSEEFASDVLDKDLVQYWDAVDAAVVPELNQCQMSVLTSWTYNVGPANMRSSTLIKRVNAGRFDDVPAQLMRWNKGRVNGKLVELRGLTRRRAAEGELWRTNCVR